MNPESDITIEEEEEVITCADCGATIDPDDSDHVNADGDLICWSCAEEYTTCADCGKVVPCDSEWTDDNGDPVCESCFDDTYTRCDECGEVIRRDHGTWIDGEEILICGHCVLTSFTRCSECGALVRDEDIRSLGNGDLICESCRVGGDYYYCAECDGLFPSSQMHYDEEDENDYCDDCWEERGGGSNIKDYSFKPEWRFHHTRRDMTANGANSFYLGVELEVENKRDRMDNNDVAGEILDRAPVVCKHDGSINNGFEVVFHPQTFDYACTDGRKGIEDTLDYLRECGFAGHNYGGMHVHVTRAAFTRLHLYKFHKLFREARTLFTWISQRKGDNLNHWASFENMCSLPGDNCNRYVALNYTRYTVEVRIFNSTLRTDRFYKNLEAVKAALDYSKQHGIRDMHAGGFMKFIMENRALYKSLATFLVEREAGLLRAIDVDVRVIKQIEKRISRMVG